MKKRVAAIVVSICLLVSGCSQGERSSKPEDLQPKEPKVHYDEAPEIRASYTLKLGGKSLIIYGEEEYLSLQEIREVIGGEVQTESGEKNHTATYKKDNKIIELSNAKGALFTGKDWYVTKSILEELGYHPFGDVEQNTVYYTAYPKNDQLPDGVKVPTLMYHAVSDQCWGIQSLFVSPKRMEEQLKYIIENGYTPIHFEDLGQVDQIEKPILLTFDDGYDDNYTELFPLLKKYNVKATIFVITDLLDTEHYLTRKQVQELSESGLVSIQSHTVSHPFLNDCSDEELETELYQSKLEITRLTQKEPFVLCYPTGKYSDASLAKTATYYEFGLLMSGKTYETGDAPYLITRKYVSRSTDLKEFISMLT